VTVCVVECKTVQQAHTELPADGASDAPKHVGVR
jgi:hypothetical protein